MLPLASPLVVTVRLWDDCHRLAKRITCSGDLEMGEMVRMHCQQMVTLTPTHRAAFSRQEVGSLGDLFT